MEIWNISDLVDAMQSEAIKFKWWMVMHFCTFSTGSLFPNCRHSLPHLSSTLSKKEFFNQPHRRDIYLSKHDTPLSSLTRC